jgi:hypothetical protein
MLKANTSTGCLTNHIITYRIKFTLSQDGKASQHEETNKEGALFLQA